MPAAETSPELRSTSAPDGAVSEQLDMPYASRRNFCDLWSHRFQR